MLTVIRLAVAQAEMKSLFATFIRYIISGRKSFRSATICTDRGVSFIDFKKADDRVWHAALWATMRKYNISANLVRTIEQLYDKATSAVQMNGSIGEWFRTTVGVRQGCLLSPTLFNIVLERIMSDALKNMMGRLA